MDPEGDDLPEVFFSYIEDDGEASLVTNMTDEQVADILEQFIRRDTGETVH